MLSKKLCTQLLDGALADHKQYVSGTYRGYRIVSYQIGSNSTQIIRIPASSERDFDGRELDSFLHTLLPLYKQFKAAEADSRALTLTFVVGTPKKFVAIANDIVPRVVQYLAQNGYLSACMDCGKAETELYRVNDHYLWLCPDCAEKYRQELEEKKLDTKAQRSNLLPGLVGAFLGALIGAVLYVLIGQLGYIAGVCGLVMAVLALKFYEKLGGCLDLKGVLVSAAVVLVMVFFANKVSWAVSAYRELRDYDWTFFECFRNLDYILEVSELKGSYTSDLVVGYLISVIGCARRFILAIKDSTGSFRFQKLEA